MQTFQELAPSGAGSPMNSVGQGAVVRDKWQLLKVVESIRETLGLKGTSIAVLRAMLSFVRSDQINATRDADHICFASNAALSARSHVSIQTVERHIAKLVDLGLLTRRASGNGKRWARRNAQGEIVLATGLSLMPLVRRHAEFTGMANTLKKRTEDLTLLRDRCSMALAKLKTLPAHLPMIERLAAEAQKLFRRKPNEAALRKLLRDITKEISRVVGDHQEELRGSGPENEGHKDTYLTRSVEKKDSEISVEVGPEQMEQAYPRLCRGLRLARSQKECADKMDDLAAQLHLGTLWFSIKDLGPALSFMILGYVLERAENIQNPRGYAWKLLTDLTSGRIEGKSLLRKPERTASFGVGSADRAGGRTLGARDPEHPYC